MCSENLEQKFSKASLGDRDRRARAYDAGGWAARRRMERDAPLDAEALTAVEAADIVVVPGSYDQVELVLQALELPHTPVEGVHLPRVTLRPEQVLVLNCPGHLPGPAIRQVKEFVRRGGTLFSTDWTLRNVLEPAFPGILEYNDRPTSDDVVRIEIHDREHRFLKGVMEEGDEPVWWLEGSSYPIRVLEPDRVEVLLTSRELRAKYGEAPVAVTFRHGQGEVFHMISHYFLQRTELRSKRHAMAASAFMAERGLKPDAPTAAKIADLSLGEVESAASSARMFANLVAEKKRRAAGARPGAPDSSRADP